MSETESDSARRRRHLATHSQEVICESSRASLDSILSPRLCPHALPHPCPHCRPRPHSCPKIILKNIHTHHLATNSHLDAYPRQHIWSLHSSLSSVMWSCPRARHSSWSLLSFSSSDHTLACCAGSIAPVLRVNGANCARLSSTLWARRRPSHQHSGRGSFWRLPCFITSLFCTCSYSTTHLQSLALSN